MSEYQDYGPVALATADRYAAIKTANPAVAGVPDAFARFRDHGDYLAVHDGDAIPWPRYTANVSNKLGLGNHFQGVQRLHRGKYMAISGGDPHGRRCSHVFVVKLGTRNATGPWGSNVVRSRAPSRRDTVVKTIGISRRYWHAGGMSVLGDILAVPIEGTEHPGSRVLFFNMRHPERPERIGHSIVRKRSKAGAVALTRLPESGRYLAAVLTGKRMDFYLSRTADFFDGFQQRPAAWRARDVRGTREEKANFGGFQTINFVGDSDGRLYLVGLHNTSPAAPTVPGRDFADLFEVALSASLRAPTPMLGPPRFIRKVAKKQFYCHDMQGNMDGAAGLHVPPEGGLYVYSTYHWRSDNIVRLVEFRAEIERGAPRLTKPHLAWIELFEHTRYAGRRLTLVGLGQRDTKIAHYGEISVQGAAFEDKISSIRYQIPEGKTYRLYAGRRFRGRTNDLVGTGKVKLIGNLHRTGYADEVSSSRYRDRG